MDGRAEIAHAAVSVVVKSVAPCINGADPAEVCAVERRFLKGFTVPMIQLKPSETILHVIHSSNTFDKTKTGQMKLTDLRLEDFISYSELRSAFTNTN